MRTPWCTRWRAPPARPDAAGNARGARRDASADAGCTRASTSCLRAERRAAGRRRRPHDGADGSGKKLKPGFELVTVYRGRDVDARRGGAAAHRARRGGRAGMSRSSSSTADSRTTTSCSRPSERRSRGVRRATLAGEPAWHSGEPDLLDLPLASLAAGGSVDGAPAAAPGHATVRDLVFHFPRRYDDFSRMMTLRRAARAAAGRSRQRDRRDRRAARRAGFPPARPAHRGAAAGRDRRGRGDLVRAALHRAAPGGRPGRRALGQGRAARLAAALPEPGVRRTPSDDALHAGRIVPVYRLTAGVSGPTCARASATR